MRKWCEESGAGTLCIEPVSAWQNGIVESLNGRQRERLLSSEIFATLAEARLLVGKWRLHYNHPRIGKLTPGGLRGDVPGAASAPLGLHGVASMHQLSQRVDR